MEKKSIFRLFFLSWKDFQRCSFLKTADPNRSNTNFEWFFSLAIPNKYYFINISSCRLLNSNEERRKNCIIMITVWHFLFFYYYYFICHWQHRKIVIQSADIFFLFLSRATIFFDVFYSLLLKLFHSFFFRWMFTWAINDLLLNSPIPFGICAKKKSANFCVNRKCVSFNNKQNFKLLACELNMTRAGTRESAKDRKIEFNDCDVMIIIMWNSQQKFSIRSGQMYKWVLIHSFLDVIAIVSENCCWFVKTEKISTVTEISLCGKLWTNVF